MGVSRNSIVFRNSQLQDEEIGHGVKSEGRSTPEGGTTRLITCRGKTPNLPMRSVKVIISETMLQEISSIGSYIPKQKEGTTVVQVAPG